MAVSLINQPSDLWLTFVLINRLRNKPAVIRITHACNTGKIKIHLHVNEKCIPIQAKFVNVHIHIYINGT